MKKDSQKRATWKPFLPAAAIVPLILTLAGMMLAQQPTGRVAYTVSPVGGTDLVQLWLVDSAGGRTQFLSPQIQFGGGTAAVASLGMPSWSRDGRLLVANALLSESGLSSILATPSKVLVVFDPAAGQGIAAFDTATGRGPVSPYWIDAAFSPDGKRLFYAALQTNFIEYGIVNRDGTRYTPLVTNDLTQNVPGLGLDWSPRTDPLGNFGNLLVVSYPYLDYSCLGIPRTVAGLFLVNLPSGANSQFSYRQLTQPAQPHCAIFQFDLINDWYPSFSPDGTKVAFVRERQDSNAVTTGSEIMVVDIRTTKAVPQPLLYLPGELATHLSWSPDSSRVMFDRTQVLGAGMTTPLGVSETTTDGRETKIPFLGQQAFWASWGRLPTAP